MYYTNVCMYIYIYNSIGNIKTLPATPSKPRPGRPKTDRPRRP